MDTTIFKYALAAVFINGAIAQADEKAQTATSYGIVSLTPHGISLTLSSNGVIDLNNDFFKVIGSNGRSCATCHDPQDGWTVTPLHLKKRFFDTQGLDPVFRANDGSNAPNLDVSTLDARRKAYSLLLKRGVIRIGLPMPANAEFELASVDDPYHYASTAELSLYRRPLASTNLKFIAAVQWDGRETFKGQTIHFDLAHQADTANQTHAQALAPLNDEQKENIVNFEAGLATAQIIDYSAGWLFAKGAQGGPEAIFQQPFYLGINDLLGDSKTGAPFNPVAFTIYDTWRNATGGGLNNARAAVARGEDIFNTRAMKITNVAGINDEPSLGSQPVFNGTCTTCHNTPNAGNRSLPAPVNIGIADASRRQPEVPLYVLRNRITGETVAVTDPGRALVTGKWKDIGRFKSATLRGIDGRAPYFHDGSAATLRDVVEFYDTRFSMGMTDTDKSDLVAFLRTL